MDAVTWGCCGYGLRSCDELIAMTGRAVATPGPMTVSRLLATVARGLEAPLVADQPSLCGFHARKNNCHRRKARA